MLKANKSFGVVTCSTFYIRDNTSPPYKLLLVRMFVHVLSEECVFTQHSIYTQYYAACMYASVRMRGHCLIRRTRHIN